MTRRLDFAAVASAAQGRWGEILPSLGVAPEYLRDRHGPCPGCGGRDRWRYDDRDGRGTWYCSGGGEPAYGDGIDLLVHAHGWTRAEALRAVALALGLADRDSSATPPTPRPAPRATVRPPSVGAAARLRRLWCESSPIPAGGPVPDVIAEYWRGRGLADALIDVPEDLRYHPDLAYWAPAEPRPIRVGAWPALLAIVRDPAGTPITMHRTWLAAGGHKAPVPAPRKLATLSPGTTMTGAAIRLYPPTSGCLILGEGVETAMAGRLLRPAWGAWATVSAGGLTAVEIPPDVREVLILADHDRAGLRAAQGAAERLARTVDVRLAIPPDGPGTDWADVVATIDPQAAEVDS